MQSPRKPAPFINAGMPMNNKYKILLVEDEPSIRKYVNALLNASGYIVIEAANCAEAKPCFLSHTPDLVLLDLGLPDGDGMQLLEFIRSRSAVPVIVLSARSDETDKVVALDGGANDYVNYTEQLYSRLISVSPFDNTIIYASRPNYKKNVLVGGNNKDVFSGYSNVESNYASF